MSKEGESAIRVAHRIVDALKQGFNGRSFLPRFALGPTTTRVSDGKDPCRFLIVFR